MTLIVIGFLIGIYGFARKVIKNEPLKGQINSIIDSANNKLSIYKDKKPEQLFDSLVNLSTKGILYSFFLCCLIILLPDNITHDLLILISPILVLCIFIVFSISWIRYHKKTFKEMIFNLPMIGVLFAPILFHLFLDSQGLFNIVFFPYSYFTEDIELIYFQIFWLIVVLLISYFGAMLIALPTYLFIYTLIFISAYIIKIVEKYIDSHILDVIVGLVSVVVLFLKIFV